MLQHNRATERTAARMSYRAETLNEEARTVEMTIATEKPVPMWGVDEVLLMSGCEFPDQIPLLDSHSRDGIENILGSVTNIRVEGSELVGTATLASGIEEADRALALIRGGHLTDVSVGYSILQETYVPENTATVVGGRSYQGPVYVVTKWRAKEASLVAIGADEYAGLRSDNSNMPGSTGQLTKGVSPMKWKLEDGREVTTAELDDLRKTQDVKMADGTVLKRFDAPAQPEPKKAEPEKNNEGERAATAERERCVAIRELAKLAGLDNDAADKAIADGTTEASFRKQCAESHREANKPLNVTVGPDKNKETISRAIEDALLVRMGAVKDGKYRGVIAGQQKDIAVHERAFEFAGLSILDCARMHAEANGIRTIGKNTRQIMESVSSRSARSGGQYTTSDFSTILENTMNKMVVVNYINAPVTWRQWCNVASANDLRAHNLYSYGGVSTLQRIGESGEVPGLTIPDGKKETLTPRAFAGSFTITDAAIINDDLGFFTGKSAELGQAAAKTVNKWVYYTLLANAAVNEDSVALFNSAHGNYTSSGGGVPNQAEFDDMFSKYAIQTDLSGDALNLRPRFILVPPAIAGTTLQFLNSQEYAASTAANTGSKNPYFNSVVPISEALLQLGVTIKTETGTATASGSAAEWYGVTDPNTFPGMTVAFYGGETPQLDQERPIEILGSINRISIYFGVAPANYRALYRNCGA